MLAVAAAGPAAALDCRLDGVDINLDNGSSYAGKNGIIVCYDDAHEIVREQEVRDGELYGYQRSRDLWGNWHERATNRKGNTESFAKEFWPDGKLKAEGFYVDGELKGVSRSFRRDGSLERLAHSDGARLEYDAQKNLTALGCASVSLLDEDRGPCGFEGERTTALFRNGKPSQRVTYDHGRLVRSEALAASGEVASSIERFGTNEVRREFHPDGKLAAEQRVVDGYRTEEREWYMNGKPKLEITREPKDRDARIETKTWRDDGTALAEEIAVDRRRISVTEYDEAGRKKITADYAPEGHLDRRRTFAPDGSIAKDEAFYPDGSRK